MASIPFATFSASKVHEQMKHNQESTKDANEETFKGGAYRNVLFGMDPVLPNYNGKLMNSIWGQYNLHASHAFQKNSEGSCATADFCSIPQAKNLWDLIHSPH